eukprot:1196188-Prorocentrum_minimum.AAC.4
MTVLIGCASTTAGPQDISYEESNGLLTVVWSSTVRGSFPETSVRPLQRNRVFHPPTSIGCNTPVCFTQPLQSVFHPPTSIGCNAPGCFTHPLQSVVHPRVSHPPTSISCNTPGFRTRRSLATSYMVVEKKARESRNEGPKRGTTSTLEA